LNSEHAGGSISHIIDEKMAPEGWRNIPIERVEKNSLGMDEKEHHA